MTAKIAEWPQLKNAAEAPTITLPHPPHWKLQNQNFSRSLD